MYLSFILTTVEAEGPVFTCTVVLAYVLCGCGELSLNQPLLPALSVYKAIVCVCMCGASSELVVGGSFGAPVV